MSVWLCSFDLLLNIVSKVSAIESLCTAFRSFEKYCIWSLEKYHSPHNLASSSRYVRYGSINHVVGIIMDECICVLTRTRIKNVLRYHQHLVQITHPKKHRIKKVYLLS